MFIILLCSNIIATYSVSLHCINIVHYNMSKFVPYYMNIGITNGNLCEVVVAF